MGMTVKKLVIAGDYSQFCRYYEDDPEYRYISCREDLDEYLWEDDMEVVLIGTFYDNPAYGSIEHRKLAPSFFYLKALVDESKPAKRCRRDAALERYHRMNEIADGLMMRMAARLFR